MSNNDKWRHLFTSEEWAWAMRTSKAIHDPQEKKEFWANMIEVKQADKNQPVHEPLDEKGRIARKYCKEILNLPGIRGVAGEDESA